MPVQNPRVIDLITCHPSSGEYTLIMVEDRPWDGSEERMLEVQTKTYAYLDFALGGQLTEHYPESVGQPVRIQLDCVEPPDPVTDEFLSLLGAAVEAEGVRFVVNVR